MTVTQMFRMTCLMAFGLLPAACAQHPEPAPMPGMSGTTGVSAHDMAGMDMPTMMNHCAQMRQEMGQGKQLAPDMQKMMAECGQMDRATTTSAPAPAATRLR